MSDLGLIYYCMTRALTNETLPRSRLDRRESLENPALTVKHGVLDTFGKNAKQICSAQHRPSDREIVRKTVELNWSASNEFIYTYDVCFLLSPFLMSWPICWYPCP